MALSKSVEESLKSAEESLRNSLSYAARQEKPYVGKVISELIVQIDNLISTDKLMDRLEERFDGGKGTWGPFYKD
jgi:hypothetical protein